METEMKIEAEAGEEKTGIFINGSHVRIEDDGMKGWLYLCPPEDKDSYTREEVLHYLAESGIRAGYHNSNLTAMVKKRIYHREILIAEGGLAGEGKNGYYEYAFPVENKPVPKIRENGSVDYTNVNALYSVKEGDVVARYHPSVPGKDGWDVRGNALSARPVKDLPALKGKGFTNEEDPNTYIALHDGKFDYRDGWMEIKKCYEVPGDVDLLTARVEFHGDIIIGGNVEAGVYIQASGNIEVRGSVEAATLIAGGDIILNRGIQGGQKGKVSAGGNVAASFIEYTVVEAGGDVVAGIILNSKVNAEGKVTVAGKKGNLVGGEVHGFLGVTAVNIGNDSEVRTMVHAGCPAHVYYRGLELKKEEKKLKRRMSEITEELSALVLEVKQKGNKLSPAMEKKLNVIKGEKEETQKSQEEVQKEQRDISAQLLKGKDAKISASGNIYRGTVISLVQQEIIIDKNTCYMNYYLENGTIESQVTIYH